MRKLLFIFLFLTTASYGQEAPKPCTLMIADAPTIRGFKLGMAAKEARDQLRYGFTTGVPFSREYERVFGFQLKPDLATGVLRIGFELLDEKITSIEITYDSSVKWGSPNEFAKAIYGGLNLGGSWKTTTPYRDDDYRMTCSGFNVDVNYGSGIIPQVRLYDTAAPGIREARRKAAEEKERKAFKP
jgi:hypothetical protein